MPVPPAAAAAAIYVRISNPPGGFDNPYADKLVSSLLFVNYFWGLVNLLPVYPLDGGQIVLNIVEAVKGSEFSPRTREYILRLPDDYDAALPHKLIFAFHARGGNASQVAGGGNDDYYGLFSRAGGCVDTACKLGCAALRCAGAFCRPTGCSTFGRGIRAEDHSASLPFQRLQPQYTRRPGHR